MFTVENRKRPRMISALLLVALIYTVVPTVWSSAAVESVIPQVTIISSQPVGSSYLEVQASMSGIVFREDESQRSYKVPVTCSIRRIQW
jgi:hypothetical protein